MKKLSFWAKTHPIQARWLIVGAHFLLFPLACLFGFSLWLEDFEYSARALDIFTTLFLLGVIGYPIRGTVKGLWRYSYLRHKAFDMTVLLTGFLSLASLTNLKMEQMALYSSEGYAIKTAQKAPVEGRSVLSKWKENTSWRALKKNFRMLKKELIEVKKLSKKDKQNVVGRIIGTFLVLLVAFGLGYLILAWSCNLACSGQEGAANVVLIGGGALLILLTVLAIRAIWKRRKKPAAPKLE